MDGNTTHSSKGDRTNNCVIQNIIQSNAIGPSSANTAGSTTRSSSRDTHHDCMIQNMIHSHQVMLVGLVTLLVPVEVTGPVLWDNIIIHSHAIEYSNASMAGNTTRSNKNDRPG